MVLPLQTANPFEFVLARRDGARQGSLAVVCPASVPWVLRGPSVWRVAGFRSSLHLATEG
jgi:hypothetical protein